ncbi:hypothetical protein I5G59_gp07 [Mycobacterium phage LilMcDreamy]|uniref:Uncharacterized protein n=1 Tax=Mycobacterium phage LilMcDreamy TaxID=2652422 RepID=A0A5P8D6G3_9CAUD|nr:hypothetical protein I5G59_gp07 [Mycobacterium phage LilMcDreamy]QFP94627.1 hypothetical protein SEA_LILMCDREAMY_7 [Mycobacterium phage LilMcDreamy]
MGDVVPFRPRSAQRIAVKVQRARKFRLEVPVVLRQLIDWPEFGEQLYEQMRIAAAERGAPVDVIDAMQVVFVGGLDMARAADQAWFTDYISPGMILICWEANV